MKTQRRRLVLFCLFIIFVMYARSYTQEQRLMGWSVISAWVVAFISTYIRGVKVWQ